jgi:flagellar basal-body rod modification protein FlgD
VNLTSSTPDLTVAITNAATGEMVKTIDLGNQSSGNIPFVWDGTNMAGTLASPGTYKIAASAPVDGKNTAFTTDINSKVESVVMANGTNGMQMNLAGGNSVDFSKVKQIL